MKSTPCSCVENLILLRFKIVNIVNTMQMDVQIRRNVKQILMAREITRWLDIE